MGVGMFGEGMKVELNRLLSSGCQVQYWTSDMIWDFQYDPDHPGAAQPTLHLTASFLEHRSHDTAVVIADPNHAVPGCHLLQRDRFLLLDPPKAEQLFGGSQPASQPQCSLQLLLGEQYRGRVYVHGTFIMHDRLLNVPGHMQLGINFTGSKQEQIALGLGRDRNSISVPAIFVSLPQLYIQLKGHPEASLQQRQAHQLLQSVTDSLQLLDARDAATRYLMDSYLSASLEQHRKAMVQDIYAVLQQRAAEKLGPLVFHFLVPDSMQEEVSLHVLQGPGHITHHLTATTLSNCYQYADMQPRLYADETILIALCNAFTEHCAMSSLPHEFASACRSCKPLACIPTMCPRQ